MTTNIILDEYNAQTGYFEKRIAWSELEEGSDLWLFYQITNFGDAWNKLIVTLTPSFADSVFYQKDVTNNTLIIMSRSKGEVSTRLSADRFDAGEWPNLRPDQDSGSTHFTLPGKP
ncbi:hypothetical protein KDA23_05440 [Candidatus Saccharibacteria bacterium]|nr:hypothetical protein [Candidatus Saccharibacteria bacterium]